MVILELVLALLQFILNLLLCICMIPFVPIVWIIREIKGVKPVTKDSFANLPKIKISSKQKTL